MKKKEALQFIKNKIGYISYSSLFEIFKDIDEISQYLIYLE
jgi:hypothetical protein